MKTIFTVIIIVAFATFSQAQIVIDQNDMPNIGDTIRNSIAYSTGGVDYTLTGTNYTWDFSELQWASQKVDAFISPGSTPATYQLIFNLPWDPNKASIASPRADFTLVPGFQVTNAYDFYKEKSANFALLGYGAEVNSIPIPVKWDVPEILYKFPLTVGTSDSTSSSFTFSLAGVGYLSMTKKRVNHVDGWGSLTTPYGTFQAIRIKSVVTEHDSAYIDTIGQGIPVNRSYTEYKWMGDNKGIPLLQVTVEGLLTTVNYIDNYHQTFSVSLGNDTVICDGDPVTFTPVITGGTPPYTFLWVTGDTTSTLTVTPQFSFIYFVVVTDATGQTSTGTVFVTVDPCTGITVNSKEEQLTAYPNPAADLLHIGFGHALSGRMNTFTVYNVLGRKVKTIALQPGQEFLELNTRALPDGLYTGCLDSDSHSLGKVKFLIRK